MKPEPLGSGFFVWQNSNIMNRNSSKVWIRIDQPFDFIEAGYLCPEGRRVCPRWRTRCVIIDNPVSPQWSGFFVSFLGVRWSRRAGVVRATGAAKSLRYALSRFDRGGAASIVGHARLGPHLPLPQTIWLIAQRVRAPALYAVGSEFESRWVNAEGGVKWTPPFKPEKGWGPYAGFCLSCYVRQKLRDSQQVILPVRCTINAPIGKDNLNRMSNSVGRVLAWRVSGTGSIPVSSTEF